MPYGPTNPPTEMEYMGYIYRIVGSDFHGEGVGYYWGTCDHTNQVIRLRKGMGYEQAVDTLLHEVLHVIWRMSGLGRKSTEEKVVGVFGTGLMHFLKSNPHVYEWIGSLLYAPEEDEDQPPTGEDE